MKKTTLSHEKEPSAWAILKKLWPYLWRYRFRVLFALILMVAAKISNVGVPVLFKHIVDGLTQGSAQSWYGWALWPAGFLMLYGVLRLSTSLLTECREMVFARVTEETTRKMALEVFEHLHALSLRFHLNRQTGGMTRDIERGTKGVQTLISFSIYSILPTLIEVALVLGILGYSFGSAYVVMTLLALIAYVVWSIKMTEWRTQFRRKSNEIDAQAHTKAIDSLLNYETVKYFNNEAFEAKRYDQNLLHLREVRLKSQSSLSLLNMGQQLIIAAALVAILWHAMQGVNQGDLSIGDWVMINGLMIQLYIPLNFLGSLYREIRQGVVDVHRMFELLTCEAEVADVEKAITLELKAPPDIEFKSVSFQYDDNRPILHDVSFSIKAGQTLAIVGASGSGKSTLARLLYRFYDIKKGVITINGLDIRLCSQASLRKQIGIVPQDTVLFNESIQYNIRYGREGATDEEVKRAAQIAQIDEFIMSLPLGYDTLVGERGLKLSGGEKQRVAIARTLLKNPSILIFDEATSALDSANESAIQEEIAAISKGKTVLIIAHRLSTVVNADVIMVMDKGRVVEQGSHQALINQKGVYARMWEVQQKQSYEKSNEA